MPTQVTYIPHPPAVQKAFHSWNGMTGTYMRKVTAKTVLLAKIEAPNPRGIPRGRTGMNYSKGVLVKTIGSREGRQGNDLRSEVYAASPYARLVHEGTKRHIIRAKNAPKMVFFWRKKGRVVAFTKVKHPGTRPNRFLLRALRRAVPSYSSRPRSRTTPRRLR